MKARKIKYSIQFNLRLNKLLKLKLNVGLIAHIHCNFGLLCSNPVIDAVSSSNNRHVKWRQSNKKCFQKSFRLHWHRKRQTSCQLEAKSEEFCREKEL